MAITRQALTLGTLLCVMMLGCTRQAIDFPDYPVDPNDPEAQLKAAIDAYEWAEDALHRKDKRDYAHKGMFYAERCLELNPDMAPCYFYKATNTGLYYEANIFGYASGMVTIAEAAQKVVELDPDYEAGGGYRILGKLYLEAPSFNIGSNEVTRDLEKSQEYLQKAVTDYPDYPENHLFFAEVCLATDDVVLARKHYDIARQQIAEGDYTERELRSWYRTMGELKQQLKKRSDWDDR
jgi:hypothetical protein